MATPPAFRGSRKLRRKGRIKHRRVVLAPSGSAGSATATATLGGLGPGALLQVAIDYTNQAATTDVVIKADDTNGQVLLTVADNATDVAFVGIRNAAAGDETGAAVAATDFVGQGNVFYDGLYFDIAQADPAAGTKTIVIDVIYVELSLLRVDLVAQSGADGTGAVTRTVPLRGAGVVQAIAIDYQNTPATADLVIKRDSSSGATLYTRSNSNTDLAATAVGMPAVDEANGATAATDSGGLGGWAFTQGLYFDLAQTDIFTGGNEHTIVDVWYVD